LHGFTIVAQVLSIFFYLITARITREADYFRVTGHAPAIFSDCRGRYRDAISSNPKGYY